MYLQSEKTIMTKTRLKARVLPTSRVDKSSHKSWENEVYCLNRPHHITNISYKADNQKVCWNLFIYNQ